MTGTTIMSAVSCGTSTNVGPIVGATKTALQATTTLCYSSFQVTTTALNAALGGEITLWQAVSPNSYVTAAAGAAALRGTAIPTIIKLCNPQLLISERISDSILACGGASGSVYHYAWLEVPALTNALAVTTKLQELP
jgi:hypothetical protein